MVAGRFGSVRVAFGPDELCNLLLKIGAKRQKLDGGLGTDGLGDVAKLVDVDFEKADGGGARLQLASEGAAGEDVDGVDLFAKLLLALLPLQLLAVLLRFRAVHFRFQLRYLRLQLRSVGAQLIVLRLQYRHVIRQVRRRRQLLLQSIQMLVQRISSTELGLLLGSE